MLRTAFSGVAGLLPSAAVALPHLGRSISSGWNLFVKEKRGEAVAEAGTNAISDVMKCLGVQWRALSKMEQDEFKNRAAAMGTAKKVDRPPTGYSLYIKDHSPQMRAEVKATDLLGNGRVSAEVFRRLSTKWRAMSDAEKQVYKDKAAVAKAKFT